MKKMFKSAFTMALAAVMTASAIPFSAYAEEAATGICGNGIRWTVDNGTLTIGVDNAYLNEKYADVIEKYGEIPGYFHFTKEFGDMTCIAGDSDKMPWSEYADEIRQLRIEEGIVDIDNYQFADLTNLEQEIVELPSTCEWIGEHALPDSVTKLYINEKTSVGEVGDNTVIYGYKGSYAHYMSVLEGINAGKFVWIGYAEKPVIDLMGAAGPDAEWELDFETGTLEISGSGTIAKLDGLQTGWVKHIIVNEGITAIDDTFKISSPKGGQTEAWPQAETISLPDSLEKVSEEAFVSLVFAVNAKDNTPMKDYVFSGDIIEEKIDESVLYGDINLDSAVALSDVVMLQKYVLESAALNEESLRNADVTNDGIVDGRDIQTITNFILKKIDKLPWSYDYIR